MSDYKEFPPEGEWKVIRSDGLNLPPFVVIREGKTYRRYIAYFGAKADADEYVIFLKGKKE